MGENISNRHKVIKGVSSQTLITICNGVVEIVSFSMMSRLLSKSDFGAFAAIMAITTIFSSISEAGIGSALIQNKYADEHYQNTAFSLSIVLGVMAAGLLCGCSGLFASHVIGESLRIPLMITSISVLFHSLSSVSFCYLYKQLKFLTAGLVSFTSLVITTIISIYLAYRGYGYYAIITKGVLSPIISLILSFALAKVHFRFEIYKSDVKSIVSFGGWLTLSVIFRNVAQQVDKLMMPRLMSLTVLGEYNRPKEFINQITGRINGVFDTVLFPVLSDIQDKRDSMKSAFTNSMYYMNILSMALALAFIFNSRLIIRIFFGEEWLDLNLVFQILSFSVIFNIDGRLADCYLRSLGLVKQQFFLRIFQCTINIIGILLGYRWGIVGVAVSVVVTHIISIMVKVLYICKKISLCTSDLIATFSKSCKYSLIIVPVLVPLYVMLPVELYADIIIGITFSILLVICFLLCPSFVGNKYKTECHEKVIGYIKKRKV